MGRDFIEGAEDVKRVGSSLAGQDAGSMNCWVQKDDFSDDETFMGMYEGIDSGFGEHSFEWNESPGELRFNNIVAGTTINRISSPSNAWSDNGWHCCGLGGDTVYRMWLDGSEVSFDLDAGTDNGDWFGSDADADIFGIGALLRNVRVNQLNGRLAEITVYNVKLTILESATIFRGVNPFVVRNDALVLYWPLWGNQATEPDYVGQGNPGGVTGTTKDIHPPVELIENYL